MLGYAVANNKEIYSITFRSLLCFPIAHCDIGKEPAATNMNAATVCVAIPNRIHP